jgi:uridine monophosphate synthetase
MIIPVSRAVINAPDPRQAALDVREAINLSRTGFKPEPAISRREMLIIKLFEAGCVRFGSFTLASGKQSPIYFDLRRIGSFPDLFTEVVHAYLDVLSEKRFDLVAGVPYAALPLGGLIAWKLGTPLIYPRKEAKSHGTGQMVEGAFQPGQKAVLVEDVITSGGSILAAAEALRAAGLVVEDAVVLVDRKQGGDAAMAPHGIHVHAVTDIYEILTVLKSHGLIDSETEVSVKAYLQGL